MPFPLLQLYLSVCCLLIPVFLSAQVNVLQYAAITIPPDLKENAHQVVRLERLEFRIKDNKEGTLYHKKVVTLLNAHNSDDELVLGYNKDTRILKMQANIYDAAGFLVRKIGGKEKEIEDWAAVDGFSIYNDARIKRLKVAHSSYPYTVEYEYEMSLRGIYYAVFPDWNIQGYHSAVQDGRFMVDMPDNMNFFFKTLNTDLAPREETSKTGRKSWVWEVKDLPAVAGEPYSPSPSSVLPRVITSPDAFQIDTYAGSMASWNQFGAFVYKLYEGRDILPAKTAEEVRRIAGEATGTEAKIAALYRYLQNNMRYVSVQMGIGGWQPFDAVYVAQNKYGDCKALTNFMKAALKEAGIEAWPALIKSGRLDYDITEDFITPRFNHVILYVPGEDIWLECTSTDYPPNYIGAGNADRNVLLVTPQGGKVVRTPAFNPERSTQSNRTRIQMQPDGSAVLQQATQSTGESHERLRYIVKNLSQEEKEKWLLKNNSLPTFTLSRMDMDAASEEPKATLSYEANLGQFGARTGKRWFVPLNPVNTFNDVPPALHSRRLPIAFQESYLEADTITIEIPKGYALESYPREPVEVQSDFGRYTLHVAVTDAGVTGYRSLRLEPARLAPEGYAEFRNFFRDVAKHDAAKLVLIQKE